MEETGEVGMARGNQNMAANRTPLRRERVAVLIPCFNEARSIRKVVSAFRGVLPNATIYVYDNLSSDTTADLARAVGAVVRTEMWLGKGNVVRRMFADIEADVYLIVDGDGTYDASVAPRMIDKLVEGGLDMVVGTRRNVYENAHRRGHGLGNRLLNFLYRSLFGSLFSDIFSGYRVFSRRFVKSFPAVSSGFEIETEMSVHACQLRMQVAEVAADYQSRENGSMSKLRTFRDGFRIVITFLILFKEIYPVRFFGVLAIGLLALALILAFPLLTTYLETGLVPRFPTAILATGLVLLAGIFMGSGLVLDSVARGRLEQKRIWYLETSAKPPS